MLDKRDLKDDLSLMQTAYAVALVLGMKNIAECIYNTVLVDAYGNAMSSAKLLFSVVLLLTIMRFFWATGNIRRFILRNTNSLQRTRKYVLSIHFLVLLMHAFVIYFLSKYNLDISSSAPLINAVRFFAIGYISLLLFNCIWLSALVRDHIDKAPEEVWIRNNVITSLVGIVLLFIAPYVATSLLLAMIVIVFIANSVYDFINTSSSYVSIE